MAAFRIKTAAVAVVLLAVLALFGLCAADKYDDMHERLVVRGSRKLTVAEGLRLMRKVEKQYPSWSPTEVVDALRGVCLYDFAMWRTLVGATKPAMPIKPGKELSRDDVDHLTLLLTRGGALEKYGLATDPAGKLINFAHVVAGVAAGQRPLKSVALSKLNHLGVGSKMDNLYAATLAGDMGQTATFFHYKKQTALIGAGSELSVPELWGDIDGMLMALYLHELSGGVPRAQAKITTVLENYYFAKRPASAHASLATRGHNVAYHVSGSKVFNEAVKFTHNYKYKVSKRNVGDNLAPTVLRAFQETDLWIARNLPLTAAELRGLVSAGNVRRRAANRYIHRCGQGVTDALYEKRRGAWRVTYDSGSHWQPVSQQRLSYNYGGVKGHNLPALCNLRLMAYLAKHPNTSLDK